MNVLLTSAGRRNYLVGFFRDALAARGAVLACDASADAAALQEADFSFVVPPAADARYVPCLLDACRRHGVGLLIPLNDLELPVLAANRRLFLNAGVTPVVAGPEAVAACFDKWATRAFLERLGVPTPRTFLTVKSALAAIARHELDFPLVVKPRWGSGSFAVHYPHNATELALACALVASELGRSPLGAANAGRDQPSVLIQERLSGPEYGLDVLNRLDGTYVTSFARRKLTMRAGETDRAVTVALPILSDVARTIGGALGHAGIVDCDLIVSAGRPFVLELNPRFGGGYPFSHLAGANAPAALIAWALGEEARPEWLEAAAGVQGAKCDRLVAQAVPGGQAAQ